MFANIGVDASQSRWLRNRILAVHLKYSDCFALETLIWLLNYIASE